MVAEVHFGTARCCGQKRLLCRRSPTRVDGSRASTEITGEAVHQGRRARFDVGGEPMTSAISSTCKAPPPVLLGFIGRLGERAPHDWLPLRMFLVWGGSLGHGGTQSTGRLRRIYPVLKSSAGMMQLRHGPNSCRWSCRTRCPRSPRRHGKLIGRSARGWKDGGEGDTSAAAPKFGKWRERGTGACAGRGR